MPIVTFAIVILVLVALWWVVNKSQMAPAPGSTMQKVLNFLLIAVAIVFAIYLILGLLGYAGEGPWIPFRR